MKRKFLSILILSAVLVTFKNSSYAKAPKYVASTARSSSNNTQEIKFGPQIAISIARKGGLFGEYKLNEALGVQVGIVYFNNYYFLDNADIVDGGFMLARVASIDIPIVLRAYPGNDRQFCWFVGPQLGYIIKGKFNTMASAPLSTTEEKVDKMKDYENVLKNMNLDLKDINEQDKVRRFQVAILAGFDYEFDFGLITGLTYTKGFVDVIKSEDSIANWSFQLALGYNFGKFLD
jgi:hypothetical protein